MSKAKDFKETFKRFDQYLNGETSKFDMPAVLNNNSPPMRLSEIDDIFGELKTEGEDRVFGDSSKLLVNPQSPCTSRPILTLNNVTKGKRAYRKKTDNQVQVPKKGLNEEKDSLDDWVVVGNDDIGDKK
ncbi:unnamed protein product [Arabis nemorensis]|uniref:Uncharacterized protein n=1 Tax=Arabis nemorensis TaxID=586526 RepID=A0A565CMC6_9BRAS|nr:unnamed protein product [Arabis nemorensis]